MLRTVGRIVHRVEVEGERDGRVRERGDELVDEHVAESEQGRDVDPVLEPGQRRLAGEIRVGGRAAGDELEDGVGAQGVVVVLVRVAGEDAEDAGPDHFGEGMVDAVGIAWIVEGGGELGGQADALVELPQG